VGSEMWIRDRPVGDLNISSSAFGWPKPTRANKRNCILRQKEIVFIAKI